MGNADEAIVTIKNMILAGELSAGSRLPSEKVLGEQLGLSRNSMREALKALELIRVVDIRHGDGIFVTALEPALLIDAISFVIDLQGGRGLLEKFEVRQILEGWAAATAAGRAREQDVNSIRADLDAAASALSIEAIVQHDVRFHRGIVEACGNSLLLTLHETVTRDSTRERLWRGLTQPDAGTRTLREHRAILDAIEHGDAKLAESLSIAHVQGIKDWIRESLSLSDQARAST